METTNMWAPILRSWWSRFCEHQADMVVGCRPIVDHPEFSPLKKLLQLAGSWTLRLLSKTSVRDAASGFRAFSREACQRLIIYSRFSYCMETLIQAGNSQLRVDSVDIRVNSTTRHSRLFKSLPEYLWKSGCHHGDDVCPLPAQLLLGLLSAVNFAGAVLIGLRFLYLVYLAPVSSAEHRTYIPSLILLAVLVIFGVGLATLAIIAELSTGKPQIGGGITLSTAATGYGTLKQRAGVLGK